MVVFGMDMTVREVIFQNQTKSTGKIRLIGISIAIAETIQS